MTAGNAEDSISGRETQVGTKDVNLGDGACFWPPEGNAIELSFAEESPLPAGIDITRAAAWLWCVLPRMCTEGHGRRPTTPASGFASNALSLWGQPGRLRKFSRPECRLASRRGKALWDGREALHELLCLLDDAGDQLGARGYVVNESLDHPC